MNWLIWILAGLIIVFLAFGIRIVRPLERGLVERLGKYNRFANQGFHWIIPIVERMVYVNITETMVDAEPQEIITKDKLNATVDAQVYFKVKDNEEDVYNSQYQVNNYKWQIVNLARTTLRNLIGTLNLTEANSDRNRINRDLLSELSNQTKSWGISIVRTELKEISPPEDVQNTMNTVVMAENTKIANIDYAIAKETEADGFRKAKIKEADGLKQFKILEAEGQAKAITTVADAEAKRIEVVNSALQKYFKNEAQVYKKLDVAQEALKNNSKYVIDSKSNITAVLSEVAGINPIEKRK